MAIELVFETHSATVDNELGKATGWLPGRLSNRGQALAKRLGDRRRHDGIAAVFASDLARAVETESIAFDGSGIPVLHDWRLRECDYGERNGMPAAELHASRREHLDRRYPGGESWRQAVARVGRFLGDLPLRWDGQRVVVIGHVATRGAWTTSSAVPRWRISWSRPSPGRKAGSTGWANVVDMHPQSARLTFRDMTSDDLDDLALLLGDPEVMTYYPRPKIRAEAAQWIDWNLGLYRTHGYGLWLLSAADCGFVGDCGLTPQVVDGVTELEVGYHVRPALHGRGYATEAAAASRDFARDVLGATRLIAIIHPDNRPSQRVAEKIGLRPEKRTTVHGGRDAIIYAAALTSQH